MSIQMSFNLESYEEQRLVRERKRKEFIRRLEAVKIRIGIQGESPVNHRIQKQVHIERHPSLADNPPQGDQQRLHHQNQALRAKLESIDTETKSIVSTLGAQILSLKESYDSEMEQIITLSKQEKVDQKSRLQGLIKQIKDGLTKNKEIVISNSKLMKELQSKINFQKYEEELKVEYEEKLKEFDVILEESNKKVESMEKELNEDEVVENALSNEELLTSLLESSNEVTEGLSAEEITLILQQKDKIIQQLSDNSEKKGEEVIKIKELSDNYKEVFDNMSKEKEILVSTNEKMTQELMQIRQIFEQILGQAGIGEEDEGIDEEEGEGEEGEEGENQEEDEEVEG